MLDHNSEKAPLTGKVDAASLAGPSTINTRDNSANVHRSQWYKIIKKICGLNYANILSEF